MFDHLNKYHVVLASNSPRRQSLLREMGVTFTVVPSQGEEVFSPELPVTEVAEFLAKQKADWFTDFRHNQLYITADTIVLLENEILGKPQNSVEAENMLSKLSGKKHQVITGVCIRSKTKEITFKSTTEVTFKKLTPEIISHYIEAYKPFDKAGSYGIQEWIGMVGIEKIDGSYFNVVGLPTSTLFDQLKLF